MDNQHKLLKLKKVIKRMEDLEDNTRRLWIDEILHKFGEDFGFWKYKAGLEQGRLEGFIERDLVEVPPFVDDWIEYCKEHNFTLLGCLDPVDDFGMSLSEGFKGDTRKCVKWCRKESNTFAIAWLFGYKVNEKKYIIKFKNVQKGSESFKFDMVTGKWYFGFNQESSTTRLYHTKEDLVNAGFEWMFSCPGFNVEEVE